MRIAVIYENGKVFQYFGHTEQFKLYDCENDKVTKEQTAGTNLWTSISKTTEMKLYISMFTDKTDRKWLKNARTKIVVKQY